LPSLKRNIEVNDLGELVNVYECALGAETGEVAFTVGLDALNRIAAADVRDFRLVRLERLDRVVADSHPAMMKVDVEGGELGVLQGSKALLANPSLKVIELETVTSESAGILSSNGFERAYYDPFRRSLNRKPINLKSSNAVFVRDWPFVATRLVAAQKVEILGRMI
jgi:FkbM family methyltransferase